MEMEVLIRELSETLINELARRDELEYEKEMKNTFISLLLAVQNKRRQYHVEKKRSKAQGKQQANGKWLNAVFASPPPPPPPPHELAHVRRLPPRNRNAQNGNRILMQFCASEFLLHRFACAALEPKYLTTVIPYHLENGTPDNQALQVLIKSKFFSDHFSVVFSAFVSRARGTRALLRLPDGIENETRLQ